MNPSQFYTEIYLGATNTTYYHNNFTSTENGCFYCVDTYVQPNKWPFYGFYEIFNETGPLTIGGVDAIGGIASWPFAGLYYGMIVTAADCLPIVIETSVIPASLGSSTTTVCTNFQSGISNPDVFNPGNCQQGTNQQCGFKKKKHSSPFTPGKRSIRHLM